MNIDGTQFTNLFNFDRGPYDSTSGNYPICPILIGVIRDKKTPPNFEILHSPTNFPIVTKFG